MVLLNVIEHVYGHYTFIHYFFVVATALYIYTYLIRITSAFKHMPRLA